MKLSVPLLFSVIALFCLSMKCNGDPPVAPELKLVVSSVTNVPSGLIPGFTGPVRATTNCALIKVCFTNATNRTVRLLKHFDSETLPIWFEIRLLGPSGTLAMPPRSGGKIQLRRELDYASIEKDQSFCLFMNVASYYQELPPGNYQLKVQYRNQYGSDCFKGELVSEPIPFVVTAENGPKNEKLKEVIVGIKHE